MQVSTNGVLSFRNPFLDFSPDLFPLTDDILIAPFWDDSDSSLAGQVFHRFTDDELVLEEISANITKGFGEEFNPVLAFIVTWDGLPQFIGSPNVVSAILFLIPLI